MNYDQLDFDKKGINIYWYDQEGDFASRKAVINRSMFDRRMTETPEGYTYKIVLECSTCGDVRFSAFGAKVKVYGVTDVIEFIYQLSKGFEGKTKPKLTDPWLVKNEYVRTIKGKSWDYFDLGGKKYKSDLIFQWYHLLWIRYLDANPGLVEYLRLFDDFNDVFKGSSKACQADSIRKYIKDGRESLLKECEELNNMFKSPIK